MIKKSNKLLNITLLICLVVQIQRVRTDELNISSSSTSANDKMSSVNVKIEENGIVPDVIDVAPKEFLEVKYKSGVSVNLGNELTPTQVKDKPTITWNGAANKFYTLLMSDPDAPSRAEPTKREVRHWLVMNIPGTSVADGEAIIEFIGSGPPKDTGLHRYVFLVFEQSTGKLDLSGVPRTPHNSRENRINTSAKKLSEQYHLGAPIAGNFYLAQYDDYVPFIHAQFAGQTQ